MQRKEVSGGTLASMGNSLPQHFHTLCFYFCNDRGSVNAKSRKNESKWKSCFLHKVAQPVAYVTVSGFGREGAQQFFKVAYLSLVRSEKFSAKSSSNPLAFPLSWLFFILLHVKHLCKYTPAPPPTG